MADLLKKWKLEQYWDKFDEQGYDDPADWINISENELTDDIGMKNGHRKKFLRYVKQLADKENEKKEDNDDKQPKTKDTNTNEKTKPKKRAPKKKCSLLFVGETGVGKSTLLAAFKDFIDGIEYDKVRPTEKIGDKFTGESQTQQSSQWELSNDEWAINIIDTPGIGDTQGFETDQKHLDNIIEHIGQFGDFNAVCILIKRGTTRASGRLKYIIGEIKSHMPKDVQDNFIVVMTRSDVPIPDKDTLAVIEKLKLPIDNIVPINNCSYEDIDLSKYKPGSRMRKMLKARQKADYYNNHKELQELLNLALEMKPYQGKKILELKIRRHKLKEQVALLKLQIDASFKTEKQIKEKVRAIENAKSIAALNKAYNQSQTITNQIPYKRNGKISTHCNACSKACHIDCGLSYGDDLNGCCCAGSGGCCTSCGHSMNSHTHMGWALRVEEKHVEKIDKNMKKKWENAQEKQKLVSQRLNILKNELNNLKKERESCIKSIQQKYNELKSIAIVGYNEDFGLYIKECIKAVENDGQLSKKQKENKIGLFKSALNTFKLFVDVVKNVISADTDTSQYADE